MLTKKPLSAVAARVKASTTFAIDALYKQMKAQGIDVVGFGAGEPNFNTPDHIKEAAIKAILDNNTRYTPTAGTEQLRAAVCRRILADCGVSYEPKQILVSSGAKHNLFIALMCLLNEEDEVILPAPYWVSYYEQVKMAGGIPVVVDTDEFTDFKISPQALEAALTDKTKAIILNSPSNPAGMVYTKEELTAIAEICVREGIYVISDEIYSKLVYDDIKFTSIAAIDEQIKALTVMVNGVSKSYAMTGWRIGYSAAPPDVAKRMADYQSHSTSCPNSIAQAAALAALDGPQDCVEAMRREFETRRNYAARRAGAIEGIRFLMPQGAFYLMLSVEDFIGQVMYGRRIESGDDFAELFLEKGLVAVVPCSGFGAPNYLRLSYAASMEEIAAGFDRLEKFIRDA